MEFIKEECGNSLNGMHEIFGINGIELVSSGVT